LFEKTFFSFVCSNNMSLGGGDGRAPKNTAASWWSATTSFFQEFSNSLVTENQETFDNIKAKAVELGGRKGVKTALSKLTETAKFVAEKTAPFFAEDVEEWERRAERKRQVDVVQSNESTYTTDPSQMFEKAFSKWKSLNPPEETAKVERTILEANHKVREFHEKLVPAVVSNYEFWSRYLFRIQQTENFLQDKKTAKLKANVTEIPLEDWGSFSESEEDDKPEEGESEDKPKRPDKEQTTEKSTTCSREEAASPTSPERTEETVAPVLSKPTLPPTAEAHMESKRSSLEEKKISQTIDTSSSPNKTSSNGKSSDLVSAEIQDNTASISRASPSNADPKSQPKTENISDPQTATDSKYTSKAEPECSSNAPAENTQEVAEQYLQDIKRNNSGSPSLSEEDDDDEEEEDWANWG